MINYTEVVVKGFILLYTERWLNPLSLDSRELVREILTAVKKNKVKKFNLNNQELENLIGKVEDLSHEPLDTKPVFEDTKLTIGLAIGKDSEIYDIIMDAIESVGDLEQAVIKQKVIKLRYYLYEVRSRYETTNTVFSHYKKLTSAQNKKDFDGILNEFLGKLEKFNNNNDHEDPAIVNRVVLGENGGLAKMIESAQEELVGGTVLKFQSERLNAITQGGLRLGTFTVTSALPHNYKTGQLLTMFSQIAMANRIKTEDKYKKPMLLLLSLEDDLKSSLGFLYRYLKFSETLDPAACDITKVDPVTVSDYIVKKLTEKGFAIEFVRIDPTDWNFRRLFDTILEKETMGFEIKLCAIDYLSMMPTVGCDRTGAMGTDVQDLFKRVRNFFSARNIALVTPHQLSTEAKELKRNGLSGFELLDVIKGGGYYNKSKQLDQEIDLEIHQDIVMKNERFYLCLQRGKHRGALIIPNSQKRVVLPFPASMPIPSDINGVPLGGHSYTNFNDLPNLGSGGGEIIL